MEDKAFARLAAGNPFAVACYPEPIITRVVTPLTVLALITGAVRSVEVIRESQQFGHVAEHCQLTPLLRSRGLIQSRRFHSLCALPSIPLHLFIKHRFPRRKVDYILSNITLPTTV